MKKVHTTTASDGHNNTHTTISAEQKNIKQLIKTLYQRELWPANSPITTILKLILGMIGLFLKNFKNKELKLKNIYKINL